MIRGFLRKGASRAIDFVMDPLIAVVRVASVFVWKRKMFQKAIADFEQYRNLLYPNQERRLNYFSSRGISGIRITVVFMNKAQEALIGLREEVTQQLLIEMLEQHLEAVIQKIEDAQNKKERLPWMEGKMCEWKLYYFQKEIAKKERYLGSLMIVNLSQWLVDALPEREATWVEEKLFFQREIERLQEEQDILKAMWDHSSSEEQLNSELFLTYKINQLRQKTKGINNLSLYEWQYKRIEAGRKNKIEEPLSRKEKQLV